MVGDALAGSRGRGWALYIGHRFADDRCLWSYHPQGVQPASRGSVRKAASQDRRRCKETIPLPGVVYLQQSPGDMSSWRRRLVDTQEVI